MPWLFGKPEPKVGWVKVKVNGYLIGWEWIEPPAGTPEGTYIKDNPMNTGGQNKVEKARKLARNRGISLPNLQDYSFNHRKIISKNTRTGWVQNTEVVKRYGNRYERNTYYTYKKPSWSWKGPEPPNGRPLHPALTPEGQKIISELAGKDVSDRMIDTHTAKKRDREYNHRSNKLDRTKRECADTCSGITARIAKEMDDTFKNEETQIEEEFQTKLATAVEDAKQKAVANAVAKAQAPTAENPATSSVTGGRRTKKRKVRRRNTTKRV